NLNLAQTKRGDEAELCRPQIFPRRENRHADFQVFTRIAHVLRALLSRRHGNTLAFALHDFLDHHGIRAGGQHRAGHDAHTLARAHRLARLLDVQRVRVVALHAADDLDDALHARPSSSSVLMLRKAAASSSKLTSTALSDAYQASIFRPPPARKASRLAATERR